MDIPIAFQSEVDRHDRSFSLELFPDAGESVVSAANKVVVDLFAGGDPEGSQGAHRSLPHGTPLIRKLGQGRSKPSLGERPPPASTLPAGGHDLALKPEQRDAVGDGAAESPTRFVLLRVWVEIRRADGAVGGKPFENQPARPGPHG